MLLSSGCGTEHELPSLWSRSRHAKARAWNGGDERSVDVTRAGATSVEDRRRSPLQVIAVKDVMARGRRVKGMIDYQNVVEGL